MGKYVDIKLMVHILLLVKYRMMLNKDVEKKKQRLIFMKVLLKIIKYMEMEVLYIKEKIITMKAHLKMDLFVDLENTHGRIINSTLEISIKVICMEKDLTYGQTE